MKKRIDVLIAEKGLAQSREKAKTLIIAGQVKADGRAVKSPSEQFEEDVKLELEGHPLTYVSRGGLKLEKAVKEFGLNID